MIFITEFNIAEFEGTTVNKRKLAELSVGNCPHLNPPLTIPLPICDEEKVDVFSTVAIWNVIGT